MPLLVQSISISTWLRPTLCADAAERNFRNFIDDILDFFTVVLLGPSQTHAALKKIREN
jgi:hypothetical protein